MRAILPVVLFAALAVLAVLAGRGRKESVQPPVPAGIPPASCGRKTVPPPDVPRPRSGIPPGTPATTGSDLENPLSPSPWEQATRDALAAWSRWKKLRTMGEPAEAERRLLEHALLSALALPLGDSEQDLGRVRDFMGLVRAVAADPETGGIGDLLFAFPGDAARLAAVEFWAHRVRELRDPAARRHLEQEGLSFLLQLPGRSAGANARRLALLDLVDLLPGLPPDRFDRARAAAVVMEGLPDLPPAYRATQLLWAVPHAGEPGIPALRRCLQDASDPELREYARLSIGRLPRERAEEFLPDLRKAMEAGSAFSALALAELGEKEAVPFLRKADFGTDASLETSAAAALACLGDDSGRESLARLLEERPEWMESQIGRTALLGLARLKDGRARSRLEALARSDDPALRKTGEEGLALLGGGN